MSGEARDWPAGPDAADEGFGDESVFDETEGEDAPLAADSPFANETVAQLLERQGHTDAARQLRTRLARAQRREAETDAHGQKRAALREMAAVCPGCRCIALLGDDDAPLIECAPAEDSEAALHAQVTTLAPAFATLSRAADVSSGALLEFQARFTRFQVLLHALDEQRSLLLLLTRGASPRRARFHLRNLLREHADLL